MVVVSVNSNWLSMRAVPGGRGAPAAPGWRGTASGSWTNARRRAWAAPCTRGVTRQDVTPATLEW